MNLAIGAKRTRAITFVLFIATTSSSVACSSTDTPDSNVDSVSRAGVAGAPATALQSSDAVAAAGSEEEDAIDKAGCTYI